MTQESHNKKARRQWRANLIKWLQHLVGIAVFAWFGFYIWQRKDTFAEVFDIPIAQFLLPAFLVLVGWGTGALQNWLIYRAAGIPVGFWQMWRLNLASQFGNYLPLRLGTVIRAQYHKVLHQCSYARFGGVFGFRVVLNFIGIGLVGVVATIGVALSGGQFSLELCLIFLGMFLLPMLVWWIPAPKRWLTENRIGRTIDQMYQGMAAIRSHRRAVVLVLLSIVARQAVIAIRFGVAAHLTGVEVTVPLLLLISALEFLVGMVALTPGALGVREAVIGYAMFAAGSSFEDGIHLGTVDRLVILVMIGSIGLLGFISVWREVSSAKSASAAQSAETV